jgi:hypothetical protein
MLDRDGRIRLDNFGCLTSANWLTTLKICRYCCWCVYASLGKALEIVLAHRCVSVGVDRMQRNFEPMRKQVEAWQRSELTDVTARWSSMSRSLKASWRFQSTWRALYTICTSSRGARTSNREPSGVSQCIHFSIQGTGADPRIQSDCQARRVLETRLSQSF